MQNANFSNVKSGLKPLNLRRYRLERGNDILRHGDAFKHTLSTNPPPRLRKPDALIVDAMRDRGYPVADFEQRTDDLSADHGRTIEDYRTAHAISTRARETDTEDLRQAMVNYRALFDELVGTRERTNA